jgi:hypothetical protein
MRITYNPPAASRIPKRSLRSLSISGPMDFEPLSRGSKVGKGGRRDVGGYHPTVQWLRDAAPDLVDDRLL